MANQKKIYEELRKKFGEVIEIMQLKERLSDIDIHIKDTPERLAKMFTYELFSGVYEDEPKITTLPNDNRLITPITLTNIKIRSLCTHYFLPIEGICAIEYMPNKKIISVNKLPRIVDYFAKRPQTQENLTQQIGDKLLEILDPEYIAVIIKAKHLCMTHRGLNDSDNTVVITTYHKTTILNNNNQDTIISKLLNLMG